MISVIRDPRKCAQLWTARARQWNLLTDWDLRQHLAKFYSIEPHFIMHETTGTVLPAGIREGKLQFYGGLHYCERNGFIGSPGGENDVFSYLREVGLKIRLLSWQEDPVQFLPPDLRSWDVPFNQYWEISRPRSFATHLSHLPRSISKEFSYLVRRYRPTLADPHRLLGLIDSFIDHTIDSFARRGSRCAYSDTEFRKMTMEVAEFWHSREALGAIILRTGGEEVGLGVFAEDRYRSETLFFLNLYKPIPSNISNCAALAVIEYACERGARLDGMRGAFSLKPRYGYSPAPSYALVHDPTWVVRTQTDLSSEALLALYRRPFGAGQDR